MLCVVTFVTSSFYCYRQLKPISICLFSVCCGCWCRVYARTHARTHSARAMASHVATYPRTNAQSLATSKAPTVVQAQATHGRSRFLIRSERPAAGAGNVRQCLLCSVCGMASIKGSEVFNARVRGIYEPNPPPPRVYLYI